MALKGQIFTLLQLVLSRLVNLFLLPSPPAETCKACNGLGGPDVKPGDFGYRPLCEACSGTGKTFPEKALPQEFFDELQELLTLIQKDREGIPSDAHSGRQVRIAMMGGGQILGTFVEVLGPNGDPAIIDEEGCLCLVSRHQVAMIRFLDTEEEIETGEAREGLPEV